MMQPTVTQRVRAFLDTEGVRLAPWATLDDTYSRLYALLAQRRDDPGFWGPLGKLMGELAAEAAAESTASVAELLGRTEIERLAAELRRALPGELRPLAEFTAALGAPVLCGFLLLGLAASAGCTGPDEANAAPAPSPRAIPAAVPASIVPSPPAQVAPPITPAVPVVDAPWFDGCALEQKGVLWRSIDRSSLENGDKRALCDCFASLDTAWTNRLSYLFRNARSSEIAKAVEEMVTCCEAEDRVTDEACVDVAGMQRTVAKRMKPPLEVGAPMYKGVCFD